jgi:hypothetical protein
MVQLLLGYASFLRHNHRVEDARPLAEEAVALCRRHPDPLWASRTRRAVATLKDILGEVGDTNALTKLTQEFPATARPYKAPPANPPGK